MENRDEMYEDFQNFTRELENVIKSDDICLIPVNNIRDSIVNGYLLYYAHVYDPAYGKDHPRTKMIYNIQLNNYDVATKIINKCKIPTTTIEGSEAEGLAKVLDSVFKGMELKKVPEEKKDDKERLRSNFVNQIKPSTKKALENPSSKNLPQEKTIDPSETLVGLEQEWNLIQKRLFRYLEYLNAKLIEGQLVSILFYGYPGTGKTLLARAIYQSQGAWFLSVSASAIKSKYVGESSKNVHALFEAARYWYREQPTIDEKKRPVVIFLDEFDGLVWSGDGGAQSDVITEFLVEMEGVETGVNEGLILIAATNYPSRISSNILSRFTSKLRIALPYPPITGEEIKREEEGESNWLGEKLDNYVCKSPIRIMRSILRSNGIKSELVDDVNISDDALISMDMSIAQLTTPGFYGILDNDDDFFTRQQLGNRNNNQYLSQRNIFNFITTNLWPTLMDESIKMFNNQDDEIWHYDSGKNRIYPKIQPHGGSKLSAILNKIGKDRTQTHNLLGGLYLSNELLMEEIRSNVDSLTSEVEMDGKMMKSIKDIDPHWKPDKCHEIDDE